MIWIGFGFILLLAAGCDKSVADRAEQAMSGYDFAGGLKILEEADSLDVTAIRLRIVGMFVEEKPAEAFRLIARHRKVNPDGEYRLAEAFFRAGSAIAREKDRAGEAAALLDSAQALDPGLGEKCVGEAWKRGLEYLAMSGDAGFRLMKWAVGKDPEALKRLRARDLNLARRYDEFVAIEEQLPQIQNSALGYLHLNGTAPATIDALAAADPAARILPRPGWRYSFAVNGPRISVEATAKSGHPLGIPAGARLKVW